MDRQRVVIVGGGVIGTMHALEAVRRGWEVVQLEADAGPRRASVRNFGLVWVSGRAVGQELELALRARELWEATAAVVPGVGFRANGSLTVATDPAELALMEEVATGDDAAARELTVLDGDGVRTANPAIRGGVLGGLLCRRDAVVEPGAVLGALRRYLLGGGRYSWLPGRRAVAVETGKVTDHGGVSHEGSLVLVCPGDAHNAMGGSIGAALDRAPLRRCRLQMMQTGPAGRGAGHVHRRRRLDALLPRLRPPRPGPAGPAGGGDRVAFGMQLLVVQRADGGLTIGDTHVYEEPFDFAVEEFLYDRLRARAEAVLGWMLPRVERRWAGVYSAATDGRVCVREEVESGVVIVTGLAGRGMTLSPAVAEETWKILSR
jgi:glycine/D-amino acid oxidase-like deaminating enzyme